jgi:dihydroorotate dehydrogenase
MKKEEPRYFISAPFGNWIKPQGTIPVTGTWTFDPRGNRLWAVVKTLRYNKEAGGWTNKLGLPNPGIKVGLQKTKPTEVLSIAETERGDFWKLSRIIPENQNIELNLSCPNLEKVFSWEGASVFAKNSSTERTWCIAKLSPLTTPEELQFLIEELGFTQLHFSNTLPFGDAGGISGPVLREFTVELIKLCRERWGDAVTIVAGGGVRDLSAVTEYISAGANHISIGSVCFNPFTFRKLLKSIRV